MPNIDLDDEFLKLFYSINNKKVPKEINLRELKQQLVDVVDIVRDLSANSKRGIKNDVVNDEEESEEDLGPAILVIDDLGVITYQLKVLLSRYGMDVDSSQEIYDAVNKFKKRKYNYVVMDLFIPTEREGFILLTELKKLSNQIGIETVIGIITASPRKEIEQQCRLRGADFFLEKNNDWQTSLVEKMNEYICAGKNQDDL